MATKKKSTESKIPTQIEALEAATVDAPAVTPVENNPAKIDLSLTLITEDVVKAKFNKELTLQKYQGAIQKLLNFNVTQDNIPEAQELLKEGRKTITAFKKIHEDGKAPAWKICKYWDNVLNSIKTPYEEALSKIDKNVQTESAKVAAENAKKKREKDRVDGINKEIDNFILDQSKKIAEATTPDQLVTVEKLIGSHKANTSRYQEFLPKLIERCGELTPMIKTQKELIKSLAEVEAQKKIAEKEGDDRALLELQEKGEAITDSIEEKKIQVQETAIYQATRPDEVTTPEPVMTAIKPRRRSWSFDIVDEKKAFAAGMLVCELNKEAVKVKLEHIKTTMGDKKEVVVDGIKYSYVETY